MLNFLPIEIFPLLFIIFAGVVAYRSILSVRQGFNYTVERFGRYTHTLKPGLHVLIPFIDRVGGRINMMENVLDVPSQDVITKDNARVRADGVVFYQILDAARAAYEVTNLEDSILNLTMTNLRTVMGSMDLDELLSFREKINARLLDVVDEATSPWGVKVTRIEIKDIAPPKDLVDAMARQMKAEREKRALVLEAQGIREAQILKAEGLKQAAILESEGKKEAAFREAEARERAAEAEARATNMLSQAISKGSVQAVNYFVAQKYMDSLKEVASAPNGKIIFMPLESSQMIGALGGIAEIAKEAFAKGPTHKSSSKKQGDHE